MPFVSTVLFCFVSYAVCAQYGGGGDCGKGLRHTKVQQVEALAEPLLVLQWLLG